MSDVLEEAMELSDYVLDEDTEFFDVLESIKIIKNVRTRNVISRINAEIKSEFRVPNCVKIDFT